MSALLLGASVTHLTDASQTTLVLFIVLFSFVVLAAFVWLVARHHRKLYGPADFRTDEAFHAAEYLPPADVGRRLSQEIASEEVSTDHLRGGVVAETDEAICTKESRSEAAGPSPDMNPLPTRQALMIRAFLAEDLVLQELQREFGSAVKRQIVVGSSEGQQLRADGVMQVDGKTMIVEVKSVHSKKNLTVLARGAILQMLRYCNALTAAELENTRFLLVIVSANGITPSDLKHIIDDFNEVMGEIVEVRLVSMHELMLKYGLIYEGEKESMPLKEARENGTPNEYSWRPCEPRAVG